MTFSPGVVLLNKTQFQEALMWLFERVESGKINGGYIFAFFDECNQEKLLPIQEQSKLTWKALAEAHLRERVRNPHDYRALSIELEGMKNAGYDWRQEFNYSIAQLTDFLNTLYGIRDLRSGILWNRIEYIPERYFYQIQDSTENWRRVSSKLISNHLQ